MVYVNGLVNTDEPERSACWCVSGWMYGHRVGLPKFNCRLEGEAEWSAVQG